MVPQSTDFRCERTRRKQYAPPRRGIKSYNSIFYYCKFTFSISPAFLHQESDRTGNRFLTERWRNDSVGSPPSAMTLSLKILPRQDAKLGSSSTDFMSVWRAVPGYSWLARLSCQSSGFYCKLIGCGSRGCKTHCVVLRSGLSWKRLGQRLHFRNCQKNIRYTFEQKSLKWNNYSIKA